MIFKDRAAAGKQLAQALIKYRDQDAVIYALPRGGVIIGAKIAQKLKLPLDLLFVKKIGQPHAPEYAICAISEDGQIVCNKEEILGIDQKWLKDKIQEQQDLIKRQREIYLESKQSVSPEGKIAILADDGIATGLTMEAAILEVKFKHPQKIIAAVPVVSRDAFQKLKATADEVIALEMPEEFTGAVGNYYDYFPQISDKKVTELLRKYGPN